MLSGSFLVFCAGAVEENDRFEDASESDRKEARREFGRDMADLDCRPAIVRLRDKGRCLEVLVVDTGEVGKNFESG